MNYFDRFLLFVGAGASIGSLVVLITVASYLAKSLAEEEEPKETLG